MFDGAETLLEWCWADNTADADSGLADAASLFYGRLLGGMLAHCAVIQPEHRGTTPAIPYGVMSIAAVAPMGTVVVLPSDHYVSGLFMTEVSAACR